MSEFFTLLAEIFKQAGFLGVFAVSGWIIGLAIAAFITWFFVWRMNIVDKRTDDLVIKFEKTVGTLTESCAVERKSWQEAIQKRDEMLVDIVDQVTETNTQLAERISTLQLLMIQLTGGNRG